MEWWESLVTWSNSNNNLEIDGPHSASSVSVRVFFGYLYEKSGNRKGINGWKLSKGSESRPNFGKGDENTILRNEPTSYLLL